MHQSAIFLALLVAALIIIIASVGCQDRYLRSCAANILTFGPVEYTFVCPPRGIALPE